MPLEHLNTNSTYLHQKYQHNYPIYVKQLPNLSGTYNHNSTYGELKGNLYGSPPVAYYYNHGLKAFLKQIGFKPSEHDPYLYVKRTPNAIILFSTTIDNFLFLASTQALIDQLHKNMLCKYYIKRLGAPTDFLNWTIKHGRDGSIHISQPEAIATILEQTKMTELNPTRTTYAILAQLDQH